jgi:hypothetical protein
MPVTYTIDPSARLIRTRCEEKLTLQEVIDHFRELGRDPACPERLDVMLDVSDVITLPESRQIETVVYEIRRLQERVRFGFCAVIAPRPALYGMLRVFEVVAQDYFREIHVFRSAAQAANWLNSRRAVVSEEPPSS